MDDRLLQDGIERLPARLTARIPPFKTAVIISQKILRRSRPARKSLEEDLRAAWRIVLGACPARRVYGWVLSTALSFFFPRSFT